MATLVEDLLLLARLDQHRPLRRERVDLLELAADAVHDARAVAPDRTVDLRVLGARPPVVDGDADRLRQVLANLLSNALRHAGPQACVVVSVGTEDGAALLRVEDDGEGMSSEVADRVFECFYRADTSRTRDGDAGGSGLGLSIVASLVSAHGGTIELATAPGRARRSSCGCRSRTRPRGLRPR